MKSTKLQRLEQKFGMAEALVEELGDAISDLDVAGNVPALANDIPHDVAIKEEESVLSMASLKQDFLMVRNNILTLVKTGQEILQAASAMDFSDLKPSHLEALSSLQNTVGSNLQLMINIYKDLAAIEKSRIRPVSKAEAAAQVNTGVINNNNTNVLFTGSSADLMELINKQTKGITHEIIEVTSITGTTEEEL